MPILASETCIFPCDLFDREDLLLPAEAGPARWSIFHTRARQEKAIARELLRKEIEFYLPLVPRRLNIRGRLVQSEIPLFGGYLFVRGTRDQQHQALATRRVAHVLPVADERQLLGELRRVKLLIDAGAPLTVESRLEPNQPVRIRSGPFAGLEGIVHRRKNSTRIVVWVHMLQQGVSLEIEDALLEPLGPARTPNAVHHAA